MTYLIASIIFYTVGILLYSKTQIRLNHSKLNNYLRYVPSVNLFTIIFTVVFWGCSYIHAIDMPGYISFFYNTVYDWKETGIKLSQVTFEQGFVLLAGICKTICPSFAFFQFTIFLFEVVLILKAEKKLVSSLYYPLVIILLFFTYPQNLAALRQSIALCFFFYAISTLAPYKPWKYIVLMIIASQFHSSAYLLIPFSLLVYANNFKFNTKFYLLLLFIFDSIWILNISLGQYVSSWVESLQGLTQDFSSKNYSSYLDDNVRDVSNFGILKVVEVNFAYILFITNAQKHKFNQYLFYSLIAYAFIGLTVGGIVAHRINYYFVLPYYTCLILSILSLAKSVKSRQFCAFLYSVYSVFVFVFHFGYIKLDYISYFEYPFYSPYTTHFR